MENGRQRRDHHSAGQPGIVRHVALGDSHANLVECLDIARQLVPSRLQGAARRAPRRVELDHPLPFIQLTPVVVGDENGRVG